MESTPARKALAIVSEANEKFCFDLYKVLCKTAGCFLYSPFSLEVVLSLVHLGAKERTAQEIAGTLHLPPDTKTILDGFSDLLHSLKCSDGSMLHTASKMYIHNKFTILEKFLSDAMTLLAEAELVDFENEPDRARTTANDWVEKKTENKVKNFIAEGALDSMTRLVLINALYFKGKWKYPFCENRTFPMPFYTSSSQYKEVPMMQLTREFLYANLPELEAQVIELPYQGNQLSMMVILPNKIDGINDLENKVTTVNVNKISEKMELIKVNITLPKFKVEKEIHLNEILKQLGMKEVFDERLANLSGITGSLHLCVNHIFHKVFIEINEEGTEAAAASGVVCRLKRSLSPVISFTADHPYLFLILHKDSKTILFCGRFA